MRISFLLPSFFAATLLSTVALAERPDNTDRPHRGSAVKERIVRESRSREAKEARQRVQSKDSPTKATPERRAPERLSEKRGCATNDGGSCSRSSGRADKTVTTKTAKSSTPMPSRVRDAKRGCATDDGSSCTSSRATNKTTKAASGESQHVVAGRNSAEQTDYMMKMRAKIEADRLLDKLNLKSCARAGTCGEAQDM